MRGWVYVITNTEFTGLVKVGFTTRSAKVRANELDGTGSAGDYRVEYEILVENAPALEKQVHVALTKVHVKKEWFRCSVLDAIATIKAFTNSNEIHSENYVFKVRDAAEKLANELAVKERQKKEKLNWKCAIDNQAALQNKRLYDEEALKLKEVYKPIPDKVEFIAGGFFAFIVFTLTSGNAAIAFMGAIFLGPIIGAIGGGLWSNRKQKAPEYLEIKTHYKNLFEKHMRRRTAALDYLQFSEFPVKEFELVVQSSSFSVTCEKGDSVLKVQLTERESDWVLTRLNVCVFDKFLGKMTEYESNLYAWPDFEYIAQIELPYYPERFETKILKAYGFALNQSDDF